MKWTSVMGVGRYVFILIAMVAATFVSRYPMLLYAGRQEIPQRLRVILDYIPPAVLIAITVPAVFIQDARLSVSLSNEYLIASIVTALVMWRTRHMILSIVLGMLVLWAWRLLILYFTV